MLIQNWLAYPSAGGDVIHDRGVVARGHEDLLGSGQQLLSAFDPGQPGASRGGSRRHGAGAYRAVTRGGVPLRPDFGISLGQLGDSPGGLGPIRAPWFATLRSGGFSLDTVRGTGVSTDATLLDALRAVAGVAAADIEPDERADGAGTLRLQLAPGADEIAVATSVNRVLREQFGLAVDANRVQVVEESIPLGGESDAEAPLQAAAEAVSEPVNAEMGSEPAEDLRGRPTLTAVPGYREESVAAFAAAPTPEALPEEQPESDDRIEPLPARGSRILISKMQLVSAGLGVTTQVTLAWRTQLFPGESSAAATPTSVHRSVAQATLRAVEGVVGGRARFELEQLELNQLGPDRAVVVVVSMLTRVGSERLTGVSVVREDVRQAVIRATLDALNRRLESLMLSA